jgi:cell division protein FtsI (penicillin-binding protein 3)
MNKNNCKSKLTLTRNSDKPKWKIVSIALFICFMFFLIAARSAQLQLLKDDKACVVGRGQHEFEIELLPERGSIKDASGKDLAMSITSHSIYANPSKIENKKEFISKVSDTIKLNKDYLAEKVSSNKSFVWLKRLASEKEKLALQQLNIAGLGFIEEPKRVYPYDHLAGQLLGFTNIDSKGIEGVEYLYDSYLSGKRDKLVLKKDGLGRIIFEDPENIKEEALGYDIVLTIDSHIQHIVDNVLKRNVDSLQAESGLAVVLDSEKGSVLAMSSYPFLDPNNFTESSEVNRKNLPIWKSFEPGSTLKPILVAGAIEEKLVNPKSTFDCEYGMRKVGDSVINDVHPYNILSVSDVISFSSNICASKIGEKLGKNRLYDYLDQFGFGKKTQVEIPGESSGKLINSDRWGPVELATISFGQGISVSALQLAVAFSSLANKGYLMKPYIVKEIVDSKGNIIKRNLPEIKRRVISYETAQMVTDMLVEAVDNGTGKNAQVKLFKVAGKTGTAQVPDPKGGGYYADKYISSFAGFAPIDPPSITVVVVIENSKKGFYGGEVAAPIFREIVEKALYYLEINPDGQEAENVIMPNFEGKSRREILRWSEAEGIKVNLSGKGFAIGQNPKPGEIINSKEVCSVELDQTI